MTPAIYFQPDAYTLGESKIMGRNSAGESFLRGYLRHGRTAEFWACVEQPEQGGEFGRRVQQSGRTEPVKVLNRAAFGALAQAGMLYFPAPGIGPLAWRRTIFGDAAWSLCGITHTTASAVAMDALAELLTAPVQPWDAVICTSRAVKDNVQRLLQAQADYLGRRLGAARFTMPKLPIIPLGIHVDDFVFSDRERAEARAALGADTKTHVVLFLGRLSFHAKAHPLAMYQALEKATARLGAGEKILLVECGRHASDFIARAFREAAAKACPSVRVTVLDGGDAENVRRAWAGADVFCSLSDNFQEAFGLTPLEAMAAGLPVVVSDWDGYRDTVRDGVDGFLVPTTMPGEGLGTDLARRHALEIDTYDTYCGLTCSFIAVDVAAAAEAFTRLFESEDLRHRMGMAGRERVRREYDWSVIIPRYEGLWAGMAEVRRQHRGAPVLRHSWPARMDPFAAFALYPTTVMTRETGIALAEADATTLQQQVIKWRGLAMVGFAESVLPTEAEVAAVIERAGAGVRTAGELVQHLPPARQAVVFRGLAWLMKLGILRRTS